MNHLTARQKQAIAEASRDRLGFASRVEPVMYLNGAAADEDDRDWIDLAAECSYGGEDGIAVTLTATLLGRLSPREYEATSCRIDWLVTRDDGSVVECPGFLGEVKSVERRGAFSTIIAATEGAEAGATPLGEGKADDRDFPVYRPDTVLYEVLSKLAYAGVEVPRTPEPTLDARGEPFSWTRSIADVIEWVESQAKVRIVDTAWNVAGGYATTTVGGEAEWDVSEGRDCEIGEMGVATPSGERVARVVVVRQEPDGTETKLAEARVDNRGRRVTPRSILVLPYDTEGTATENERSAYAVAYEEAVRLSGLPAEMDVPLNYPPFFLSRGKAVSAATREYTQASVISERRLMRCEDVVVDVKGKTGAISGESRLLRVTEEPLVVPRFARASGVVEGI